MIKDILAKILFCDPKDIDNVLLHIPVGIANVCIALFSDWVAGIFGLGFIVYQLNEQKVINDKAYPAIQGFLYGIGILAIVLLVMSWLK